MQRTSSIAAFLCDLQAEHSEPFDASAAPPSSSSLEADFQIMQANAGSV